VATFTQQYEPHPKRAVHLDEDKKICYSEKRRREAYVSEKKDTVSFSQGAALSVLELGLRFKLKKVNP